MTRISLPLKLSGGKAAETRKAIHAMRNVFANAGDTVYMATTGNEARLALATATTFIVGNDGTKPIWQAAAVVTVSPADIQTFTTPGAGTWTKPAGAVLVLVREWGPGGSGANRTTTGNAGGGAGGAYAERWYAASALNATESLSVGAGGVSVASSNANGNVGGDTTFSSGANLLTAFGGGGGAHNAVGNAVSGGGEGTWDAAGAAGGGAAANTQTIPTNPWNGGQGGSISAANNANAGSNAFYGGAGGGGRSSTGPSNGAGGDSKVGGDGGAAGNPGVAGTAPGGGGGASGNGGASGAGAAGRIEVYTFV